MFRTFNAGKAFGIPVSIHWSLSALFLGLGLYGLHKGGLRDAAASVGFFLIVFASVLLHELGHVVAARWFGIRTESISLNCLGGSANFATEMQRPIERFVITIAGPLVNTIITVASFVGLIVINPTFEGQSIFSLEEILIATIVVNAMLAVTNMLPIYPLDGGHIMRALISSFLSTENAKRVTFSITFLGATALATFGLYIGSWVTVGTLIFLLLLSYMELGNGINLLQKLISVMRTQEALGQILDIQSKGFDRELVAKAVIPCKIPRQFVAFTSDGRYFARTQHWAAYNHIDDRIGQMKVILAYMKTARKVGGKLRLVTQYELDAIEKADQTATPPV